MGGFYDFYRELERRANVAVRVSVQDGPVLWEDVAARDVPQEVLVERDAGGRMDQVVRPLPRREDCESLLKRDLETRLLDLYWQLHRLAHEAVALDIDPPQLHQPILAGPPRRA